ncbi:MAG: UPF0149 family protein [Gammaproteobacteria bacterium]|nr:UPF0149 family protein [Gammaproteobacteria bacterium]
MEQGLQVPGYGELNQALMDAGITTPASEAQGLICGVLCAASTEAAGSGWVPILLADHAGEEGEAIKTATRMLIAIHQQLIICMQDKDFALRLVLPDEEQPVAMRLDALAEWCSGFLMGLVAGGAGDIARLPPDSAEIARDMLKITEVVAAEEAGEDDEESLMQLEEYVRLGALAIYDELHPQSEAGDNADDSDVAPDNNNEILH